MSRSRKIVNRIKRLHKKKLQIVYDGGKSYFQQILDKDIEIWKGEQ